MSYDKLSLESWIELVNKKDKEIKSIESAASFNQRALNMYQHFSEMKEKQEGLLEKFEDDQLAVKMMAMGILPGSHLTVIRKNAFGNTFYVRVDQMRLAIRKKEAECIVLK